MLQKQVSLPNQALTRTTIKRSTLDLNNSFSSMAQSSLVKRRTQGVAVSNLNFVSTAKKRVNHILN